MTESGLPPGLEDVFGLLSSVGLALLWVGALVVTFSLLFRRRLLCFPLVVVVIGAGVVLALPAASSPDRLVSALAAVVVLVSSVALHGARVLFLHLGERRARSWVVANLSPSLFGWDFEWAGAWTFLRRARRLSPVQVETLSVLVDDTPVSSLGELLRLVGIAEAV